MFHGYYNLSILAAEDVSKPQTFSMLMECLLEGYFSDGEDEDAAAAAAAGKDAHRGGAGRVAVARVASAPPSPSRLRGDAWEELLLPRAMELPSEKLKDMLQFSLEQGNILVLYFHLRKKRPTRKNIQEEEAMISTVLDWLRHIKMRCVFFKNRTWTLAFINFPFFSFPALRTSPRLCFSTSFSFK